MKRPAALPVRRVLTFAAAALPVALLAFTTVRPLAQPAADPSAPQGGTLTRVGQAAPAFEAIGLDGQALGSDSLRGKVGVVVFWATWCPACRAELPLLEKEVWTPHRSSGLAMVAIARGETADQVRPFREQYRYTMPMAVDPDRGAYERFATEGIPRTYVLSRDGRILFQSVGYDPAEFAAMKRIIERELRRMRPAAPAGGRGH